MEARTLYTYRQYTERILTTTDSSTDLAGEYWELELCESPTEGGQVEITISTNTGTPDWASTGYSIDIDEKNAFLLVEQMLRFFNNVKPDGQLFKRVLDLALALECEALELQEQYHG